MSTANTLQPLPYHQEIAAYLQREEAELWEWFSSNRVQVERADAVRLELLKTTYRIERDDIPRLHELAAEAADRLKLDVPITFYQSQQAGNLNVSVTSLLNEAHIVMQGPLTELLSEAELRAILGHELSHLMLWKQWDEQYLIADQVLSALANASDGDDTHRESATLYRLYSEIFCDRGGLLASGELSAMVAALVKTETGLKDVNAESYLRQSDEIFSSGQIKTDQYSHPECFIRARSLRLWHETESAADAEIHTMIEGRPSLDRLDLLGQVRIAEMTRRLIDALLGNSWLQSESIVAHARQFFPGYAPPTANNTDDSLAAELAKADDQLQDYFCYVLLDFATTDRDLDEAPLAAVILLAKRLALWERLEPMLRKELSLRKKQLDKIAGNAEKIIADASQTAGTR